MAGGRRGDLDIEVQKAFSVEFGIRDAVRLGSCPGRSRSGEDGVEARTLGTGVRAVAQGALASAVRGEDN
ncbi:hypothetical protein Ais01nite_55640 [Asanoa ishikariensis]|nr:hypothetical protein Ais01nite_55640 [Asanoa ishikariensis]